MAQDSGSNAEVSQVLETMGAPAEQAETAIAPLVLPPEPIEADVTMEPTLPMEDPNQSKEDIPQIGPQTIGIDADVHFIQEEADATTGLESAEEGLDMDGEDNRGTSAVSEEELHLKLKRERKRRLKDSMKKRFNVDLPPKAVKVEDEDDDDEDRQDIQIEEPPFIDIAFSENFEYCEEEEDDYEEQKSFTKKPSKMVGIFSALPQRTSTEDDDIFYKDPKYDLDDNLSNYTLKSIISMKSTKSIKYITEDPVQLKADFLRDFEIPSLSDISEEHEPEPTSLAYAASARSLTHSDPGHFVNPMGGSIISSSASSSEPETASLFAPEEQEAAPPETRGGSSDISDIPEKEDEAPNENKSGNTFDDFHRSFVETLNRVQFEDEGDNQMDQAMELNKMVEDFVEDLLRKLIGRYERAKLTEFLRSKCDKRKLLDELRRSSHTYIFERYTNEMLASRLADYFKRLRNERVFARLDEEKEEQYLVRYNQALARVDFLKEHLDAIKHRHALQMQKVILDLHSIQSVVSFTESRLEKKVRQYLVRPDSDLLGRYVDRELRQMNAKRNEISDMRVILINKTHTLGHLKEKIKELETLSSTVSIQDFISMNNGVVALEKKIEERSIELNKIRTQYHMDVHITHHNREKASALGHKLQEMKVTLKKAVTRQRSLRSQLYEQKLERTKMREMRKELIFQGGILVMPSLMYEYDHTVQQVKDTQERVSKLKETVKMLNRRVSVLEGRRSL